MTSLNARLSEYPSDDDKEIFLYDLFEHIKNKVYEIITFGACNSLAAIKTRNIYDRRQQSHSDFFPTNYSARDLEALPAVIANILKWQQDTGQKEHCVQECYESYFTNGYLYGTGTCEIFSIVGAYLLATEFEIELSIETIYSNDSHTYIRLHTEPEYIFDFWAMMTCQYDDQKSWNEFFGKAYLRDEHATIKTAVTLNTQQLLAMGDRVLTRENNRLRADLHGLVRERVAEETRGCVSTSAMRLVC